MKSNVEGNYRVVDKIGEGTYGVVYKAVDQRVGDRVVIKKVKVRKPEDGLPKELVREIEATNALRSAYGTDLTSLHIVNLREVFLGSTSLNIVYSPYCPELDITSLLGKKLSSDQANDIAKHMLRALAAVHDAKLVHRDIKPANLLVGPEGIILCDFGQCRVALDTIDSDEAR